MPRSLSPLFVGAMLAVFAAFSFGITTPVVALAGRGVGPLATAALLYLGACLPGLVRGPSAKSAGAALTRAHLRQIAVVTLMGAVAAPALLAWGLQRAGAVTGSLLLNLEGVFTVLLARVFYREPIGGRVVAALSLMVLAGSLLALDSSRGLGWNALGSMAVAGAALAWALDNTLTRPLSELSPVVVVTAKGGAGALLTGLLSWIFHERLPSPAQALLLVVCGATGYGLSLRLYLHAQRRIGAGRTGSIFAVAPFIGAATAFALGAPSGGFLTGIAAGLFVVAVVVHATERHHHRHVHESMDHDHVHRHDDGHHDHAHVPPVVGKHAHWHHHGRVDHEHDHAPDVHHRHEHS